MGAADRSLGYLALVASLILLASSFGFSDTKKSRSLLEFGYLQPLNGRIKRIPSTSTSPSSSSTVLSLSSSGVYTGTYTSRRWTEEENDALLKAREEMINPDTGKVRRGAWTMICGKISAMTGDRISVKVAQHQADNVLRRRRGEDLRHENSKPTKDYNYLVHKWSEYENNVLMKVRAQYIRPSGRVQMGSWSNITREVSDILGFEVGIHQASKRAKDIERRHEKARAQRGGGAEFCFTTTLDASLVEQMLADTAADSGSDADADNDADDKGDGKGDGEGTLYTTTTTLSTGRSKGIGRSGSSGDSAGDGERDIYRPWTLEDTKLLIDLVDKAEAGVQKQLKQQQQQQQQRKKARHGDNTNAGATTPTTTATTTGGVEYGKGRRRPRPRGFWMDIADQLDRCPIQCRQRLYWLRKADQPLFMM
jgi:hypothetical protein